MDRRFEEKVAVITGAAGGIGRAAVERFTAEGAKVVPPTSPTRRSTRAWPSWSAQAARRTPSPPT